jgi:uncharacterized membrane protein YidH (DUF202 family)
MTPIILLITLATLHVVVGIAAWQECCRDAATHRPDYHAFVVVTALAPLVVVVVLLTELIAGVASFVHRHR